MKPANHVLLLADPLQTRHRGYVLGMVVMAVLVVVRWSFLDSWFESSVLQRFFILPVIAAAWSGGLKPGLFTTLLGVFVAPLFFGETELTDFDWQMALTYVMVGVAVSSFMESLHATRRRLEDRQQRLEHEIQERRKAEASERVQRDLVAQESEGRALVQVALREEEERVRMAVESASIGTWDLNVLTGERKWSDRCREMFGVGPDENISKLPFVDLLHPEDRDRVQKSISRALDPKGTGRYQVDYRVLLRGGTTRWIVAMGQAFFSGEAEARHAIRFIGTVFDFTERKELEQALQDADRRKDEFLATLAHELRNPLAPISYGLQLWPSLGSDPAKAEELIAMMARQVEQMTRLIDDLLDVSRITRGKIELRKEPAELGTIIKGAIESVQAFVESCGHRITLALPEAAVPIDADVARLVQVFANILNNAAKFTSRNGVIWVSLKSENRIAEVRIRDNGPGIPQHLVKDIFEMFHQVDGTVSRSTGGLGIGLTLVKNLVELHGGTIHATSPGPGQGSEFVVSLPVLLQLPESNRRSPPRYRVEQFNDLPRHRILVVDDVHASAQTLSMMLRRMGQTVTALNDGPSAIDWIIANEPDVVFLDIAMPGMSGYDVARRLRKDLRINGPFLVALTGYGQDEDRRQAFEAGFNHHLVKPTRMDSLEQVLRSAPVARRDDPLQAPDALKASDPLKALSDEVG